MRGYSFSQNQQEKLSRLGDYTLGLVQANSMGENLEVVVNFQTSSVCLTKVNEEDRVYYEVTRRTEQGLKWKEYDSFDDAYNRLKNLMEKEDRHV